MNIEKHRAFIESLDHKSCYECPRCGGSKQEPGMHLQPCDFCGGNGLIERPDGLHGIPFNADIRAAGYAIADMEKKCGKKAADILDYWVERCRLAESRQIPDLKEKVKELVRDAMDTEIDFMVKNFDTSPRGQAPFEKAQELRESIRALCAEVKP